MGKLFFVPRHTVKTARTRKIVENLESTVDFIEYLNSHTQADDDQMAATLLATPTHFGEVTKEEKRALLKPIE